MDKQVNTKKVWAILHATHEDLGSFETILRSYRVHPRILRAQDTDIAALDPVEADLVFIMGGGMGVYEADAHPHLRDEIDFVQKRIAAGKPLIGVCLGSQIMAAALGAKVYKGKKGKEIGWYDVHITPAANGPLRHLDAAQGPVMHWHGDTFDLPDGAVRLASSALYENQAFAVGDHALALQFHPEVTELKLERWYDRHASEMAEEGISAQTLRDAAHAHAASLRQRNRRFLTEWLGRAAPHLLVKEG